MFSCFSKKSRLVNRLWKLRQACVDDIDENNHRRILKKFGDKKAENNSKLYREFYDFKRWFFKILTNLTLRQLENLLEIVQNEGSTIGECILFDSKSLVDNNSLSVSSDFSQVLVSIDGTNFELTNFVLKTFCRPELTSSSLISPLPWCSKFKEENDMVCLNPYHFGVLHAAGKKKTSAKFAYLIVLFEIICIIIMNKIIN